MPIENSTKINPRTPILIITDPRFQPTGNQIKGANWKRFGGLIFLGIASVALAFMARLGLISMEMLLAQMGLVLIGVILQVLIIFQQDVLLEQRYQRYKEYLKGLPRQQVEYALVGGYLYEEFKGPVRRFLEETPYGVDVQNKEKTADPLIASPPSDEIAPTLNPSKD